MQCAGAATTFHTPECLCDCERYATLLIPYDFDSHLKLCHTNTVFMPSVHRQAKTHVRILLRSKTQNTLLYLQGAVDIYLKQYNNDFIVFEQEYVCLICTSKLPNLTVLKRQVPLLSPKPACLLGPSQKNGRGLDDDNLKWLSLQ